MKHRLLKSKILASLSIIFIFCSCSSNRSVKLFQLLDTSETNIHFANNIHNEKDLDILQYNYFYNGGGVAAADFNNDGFVDLYFTGNQVSSKLYLNKGKERSKILSFDDVTEKAGVATTNWATGIAVADINNDGFQDMYVSYAGYKDSLRRKHQLFVNKGIDKNGIPKFIDEAAAYGLADTNYTTQSAFFDYDVDGDLDLLLINHYQDNTNPNFPKNKDSSGMVPGSVKLYRNDKNVFSEVSVPSGIKDEGYSLGVTISDINLDGWPDIYIAKDFIFDDVLYINNKDGSFTESIRQLIRHTSQFSMGCDVADFNNDCYPDIVTADMLPYDNKRQKLMNIAMNNDRFNHALSLGYLPQYSRNMLQLNSGPDANGNYSFAEIGQLAGVYKTDWSWSPLIADFNNDGWKDLFISNGIPKDITNNDFVTYRGELVMAGVRDVNETRNNLLEKVETLAPVNLQNFIFENKSDLTFTDMRDSWGLDHKGFSNGAVYVDLDNDGDLDLVTNNLNDKASVYRNNGNTINANHYLSIRLKGNFSSGAKIIIDCKGKKQYLEHYVCRGFQSSQDPTEHFGLGKDSIIDTLTVEWLSGKRQQLINIKSDQLLLLEYKNATDPITDTFSFKKSPNTIFTEITDKAGFSFVHTESTFEDFNYEPLLPHRFSTSGPYIAVGDVNADGLEDYWIGGPDNQNGKFFFQQKSGAFVSKVLQDSAYEDMGGLLFDADGDKDLDLYVVSGGNEYTPNSKHYQDRLYFNDGKGNFSRTEASLPAEYSSGSIVTACDFDKDGDEDLFVGGRVVPGSYSYSPESFLLQNDGKGKFSNITDNSAVGLKNIGMVATALWTDINNDGWTDLMVTGEWMGIIIFNNEKGLLTQQPASSPLHQLTGWWNCLQAGDFNKDGNMDYIAGNLGSNNKFHVADNAPLTVYASDFDNNGSVECIMSYYLSGKEYTVANRDQITSVLPSIKKQFDNYTKFSEAGFSDIFKPADLQGATVHKAANFKSVYLENMGGGKFNVHPLPVQAQFSTIQSMQTEDFDHDGHLDLLIAGNNYGPDFMIGRYDASAGLLLSGDGKGGFHSVPAAVSGLRIFGDARNTAFLKIKGRQCLLASVNSGRMQVYQLKIK